MLLPRAETALLDQDCFGKGGEKMESGIANDRPSCCGSCGSAGGRGCPVLDYIPGPDTGQLRELAVSEAVPAGNQQK